MNRRIFLFFQLEYTWPHNTVFKKRLIKGCVISLPGRRLSRHDPELSPFKVGNSSDQRELLQTFHLKGSSAARIFAGEDFKKFVTVDDAGLAYVLEEIPALV